LYILISYACIGGMLKITWLVYDQCTAVLTYSSCTFVFFFCSCLFIAQKSFYYLFPPTITVYQSADSVLSCGKKSAKDLQGHSTMMGGELIAHFYASSSSCTADLKSRLVDEL